MPEPAPEQPDGTFRTIAGDALGTGVLAVDGGSVFLSSGDGIVSRTDLLTGSTLGRWQVGSQLGGMDVTPDGRYLVATELTRGPTSAPDGDYRLSIYVHRLEITTGIVKTLEARVPVSGSAFYDIATLNDGTALVSQADLNDSETPLYLLDIEAGTFTATAETFPDRAVLAASSDHSHVLIAPQSATSSPLYVYTAGQGITASHASGADGVFGVPSRLIAQSAGGELSLQSVGGRLYVYDDRLELVADLTARHPEFATRFGSGTVAAAFSPDGSRLYLLDVSADKVFEISTSNFALHASIPIGFDAIAPEQSYLGTHAFYGDGLQISSDGRFLGILTRETAYDYDTRYQVIDLSKVVAQTDLDRDNVIEVALGEIAYGFGGNDLFALAGGGSAYGGSGDDVYVVSSFGGGVVEQPDEGYDTVYAPYFTLTNGIERLIGTGTGASLTGSNQDNIIVGTAGRDSISPGGGSDVMTGNGEQDRYSGLITDFDGDTITDFDRGDTIRFSNAYLYNLNFSVDDGQLTFGNGYVLDLPGLVAGQLVASELTLYQRGGYTFHELTLSIANQPANLPDFNGDGHGDILWRNLSGEISEWQLSGRPRAEGAVVAPFRAFVDPSWEFVDTFDFNGDGRSDILWRNVDGTVSVWNSTGSDFVVSYTAAPFAADARIAAIADLNDDGKDDLILQRADGAISVANSTGTGFSEETYLSASPGQGWHVVGAADFNDDFRADLLWRNDSGAVSVWSGTAEGFEANTYLNVTVDTGWHIEGLADFTGDGQADILWRNEAGQVSQWRSHEGDFFVAYINNNVPLDWNIASIADFNNDGRADILWRNDSGAISTWEASTSGFVAEVYQNAPDSNWNVLAQDYLFG